MARIFFIRSIYFIFIPALIYGLITANFIIYKNYTIMFSKVMLTIFLAVTFAEIFEYKKIKLYLFAILAGALSFLFVVSEIEPVYNGLYFALWVICLFFILNSRSTMQVN